MLDIFSWMLFAALIAGLLVLVGLLLRGYVKSSRSGTTGHARLFGGKPEKRLDIVDQVNVDGRRRLLLIRRDNVEHLLMTGGPVDVVIETGIGSEDASLGEPKQDRKHQRNLRQSSASLQTLERAVID
ncbi:MAG: hypothetical protein ACR2PG_01160 [Hyphomicrobiaceae bacterium]